MNNLREAAQQALEALEASIDIPCYGGHPRQEAAAEALRAALAQPVQEPVAWRTFDGEGGYDYRTYEDNEDYAAEWAKRNPRHLGWVEPLYTAPPQRKPLTDEEIVEIRISMPHFFSSPNGRPYGWSIHYTRVIERAHGIF